MRAKGIRVDGSRPDGVILVDLGDRSMVLVNVVDHVKTAVLSERAANLEGPWRLFSGDVRLNDEVRERIQRVIDQPGNIVPPSAVGAIDYDHHTVYELGGPTRQEFADMLEAAHLSVGEELPSTQNFQDDSQWLMHCLNEIVPSLQQSGIEVGDPNSFCALLHLERTGIMPRAIAVVVPAAPAVPTPAQSTADMAVPAPTPLPSVPVALADNPFAKKDEPGDPMGTDDESVEDPDKPTAEEKDETSLGDDEPSGDEGGGEADDAIARGAEAAEAGESGDTDPVDAKVTEIESALDAANGLIDELLGLLKVDTGEGFDSPDKTLAMNAKLSAVRKFAMPPEPNDAGLPGAVLPTPVSVEPHGVAGGAPGIAASDEPGKENEVVDPNVPGKPELPSMPGPMAAAAGPMMGGGGGACIGKPNKKAVAACDTPKT